MQEIYLNVVKIYFSLMHLYLKINLESTNEPDIYCPAYFSIKLLHVRQQRGKRVPIKVGAFDLK